MCTDLGIIVPQSAFLLNTCFLLHKREAEYFSLSNNNPIALCSMSYQILALTGKSELDAISVFVE